MKFKTTIKCAGCIATVTPVLDKIVGNSNWKVDTQTPEKILTVTPDEKISAASIIAAIAEAGYKAEQLN